MQQLIDAIHKMQRLLLQVKAAALTPQLLSDTENRLSEIDVHSILENYSRTLPVKHENGEDEKYTRQVNAIADQINKELAPLNITLDKIKQLRETLNLPALDGIIHPAQKIIRSIYLFTSNLSA